VLRVSWGERSLHEETLAALAGVTRASSVR
jgi:hypothetical protein